MLNYSTVAVVSSCVPGASAVEALFETHKTSRMEYCTYLHIDESKNNVSNS